MTPARTLLFVLGLSAPALAAQIHGGPVGGATLSSGVAQTFTVADPNIPAGLMTITDGAIPVIKSATGLQVIIPPGLSMTWVPLLLPTFGGSAVAKMNPGVTLSNGNKTATFSVKTDFAANDTLTIANMQLGGFAARSLPGTLGLDWTKDGTADAQDAFTKAVSAPTVDSAADQVYRTNDPITPIGAITVTEDAAIARITTAKPVKIRIPAGLAMTFDPGDTSATMGGTASAKVNPTVIFSNGNKTMSITVTANWAAGDTLTVSGLGYTGFAVSAASRLELETSNANTVADTDSRTITVADPPTFASAGSQVFTVGDPPTPISVITYTEGALAAATPTTGMRFTIPASVAMTWNSADSSATFGGSASAKVSGTVSFTNLDKTLVVTVTTPFAGGDTLTIDGLSFANFTAGSAAASLTLEVDADAAVDGTDATAKSIGAPTMFSGAPQSFLVGAAPTAISPITVADGTVARITMANGIRLRIPAAFPMTWLSSDTTATLGGGAAGKVLPTVTYEDADRTVVLSLNSDFAGGDSIIVSGLSFANFSGSASPAYLDLEVNNLGTAAATDINSITVVDPFAPPPPVPPVDPGGSTGTGNCGLLGAEVVVILALLKVVRRRA